MTTHTAYVTLPSAEFDRINRLLEIDCLEEMTDAQLREHGANTDVCEGIFHVEFDNGATLNLDLCSGSHNYYDDMVWTSPDGKHDITLDCEYELDDDIEFEINNELYVVKIFHDDKFHVRYKNNTGEDSIFEFGTDAEAEDFIRNELEKSMECRRSPNYSCFDVANQVTYWVPSDKICKVWIRLWKNEE